MIFPSDPASVLPLSAVKWFRFDNPGMSHHMEMWNEDMLLDPVHPRVQAFAALDLAKVGSISRTFDV